MNADGVQAMELDVTKVDYLVVIGDGVTSFMGRYDTNNVVKALQQVVERRFGARRVVPAIVSPSATAGQVVREAAPTFSWTIGETDEAGYTAFKVQVADAAGKVIYDSGVRDMPARDVNGVYSWTAPLFAGDVLADGTVYANNADYSWKVTAYNAKFRTDAFSAAGAYKHVVGQASLGYGSVPVAVRYFGPTSAYADKVIRVRAYTSPDFTGAPVAGGYVALPDDPEAGVAHAGKAVANCTLLGLPKGTYYLQAFIDSNANGVCDAWESMGYLCERSGQSADWLAPVGITFGDTIGASDLAVIYVEDADTDGDSLPDAWEYATYKSLDKVGVTSAKVAGAGDFVVNPELSGRLSVLAGKGFAGELAGELQYTIGSSRLLAALVSGVEPAELEPEVTLTIANFAFDSEAGAVRLDFDANVTKGKEIANAIYTIRCGDTLKLQVYHKASLTDEWEKVGPVTSYTIGAEAVNGTIVVPVDGIGAKGGFFTVGVER